MKANQMCRKSLLKVIPALFLLCVTYFAYAGAVSNTGSIPNARKTAIKLGFPPPLDWTTEKWSGNDKPYVAIRKSIDKVAEKGQFRRSILEAFRKEARIHRDDPIAQYRWGYAFYMASNEGFSLGTIVQDLDAALEIAWAMQQAPSPHSYEYTRLLFINSAQRSMYKLIPLGRRLLLHTPNDYDVEYYFYKGLASAPTQEERNEALIGAENLIKKYPTRGGPYGALAEVYSARWEKGDVESGPLALSAYQKYLSMPPKGLTPQDRQGLEYWMNYIKTHPNGPKKVAH